MLKMHFGESVEANRWLQCFFNFSNVTFGLLCLWGAGIAYISNTTKKQIPLIAMILLLLGILSILNAWAWTIKSVLLIRILTCINFIMLSCGAYFVFSLCVTRDPFAINTLQAFTEIMLASAMALPLIFTLIRWAFGDGMLDDAKDN